MRNIPYKSAIKFHFIVLPNFACLQVLVEVPQSSARRQ